MKTIVIYHRADFDGIFCREISKKFMPDAELIGWDFGDKSIAIGDTSNRVYILDLPVDRVLGLDKASSHAVYAIAPNIVWIDHHKSSIESHATDIPGYRIDGVAACRLAWQWFSAIERYTRESGKDFDFAWFRYHYPFPKKSDFYNRTLLEPLAVRLAGEYDIWDKRDPRADLFQHGLRSRNLCNDWGLLLSLSERPEAKQVAALRDSNHESLLEADDTLTPAVVHGLLDAGLSIHHMQTQQNEDIIKAYGFDLDFEGLKFCCCNHARFNSHLFSAGLKPEHDGCLGFNFDGQKRKWRISLYGVPYKPDLDLSVIAVKFGGGGHKQACGFMVDDLSQIGIGNISKITVQTGDVILVRSADIKLKSIAEACGVPVIRISKDDELRVAETVEHYALFHHQVVDDGLMHHEPVFEGQIIADQATAVVKLLHELFEIKHLKVSIEMLAGCMYGSYCEAVGGKAFNGDLLPAWDEFRADASKRKQSEAWIKSAERAVSLLR